ncbi:MAG: hypothetical protein KIT18_00200 [Burkholderiales bacterium]|nr:hypothetical protein [Burkholderiales bacterium]
MQRDAFEGLLPPRPRGSGHRARYPAAGQTLRDVEKVGGAAAQRGHHHDARAAAEGVDCNADFTVLDDEGG